ncbi:hypothetical protein [Spongiimicrobium salis]|uniref:hypothetical protein n=1 Tax=Spongiimicrobium salis TaxID=1667022 RepID=UPI00374CE0F8
MEKFYRHLKSFGIVLLLLHVMACQVETNEPPMTANGDAISVNSPMTRLLKRTAAHDGSFDNIVDGVSCVSLVFPYTIEVNDKRLSIDSVDDFIEVEELLDADEDNQDQIIIFVPITVQKPDFTQVVVNSMEEFDAIANACVEGGDDLDIECVDFVYPLTFFSFRVEAQFTDTDAVNSDEELTRYLNGLSPDDFISIRFPIGLELANGTRINANDATELTQVLLNAVGACDEDDDDDHSDDDFTEENLRGRLVSCPWDITRLTRNEEEVPLEEGRLTFMPDNTVLFEDGNTTEVGQWTISPSDDGVIVELQFENYEQLNFSWIAHDTGEGRVRLFGTIYDKLLLQMDCDDVQSGRLY